MTNSTEMFLRVFGRDDDAPGDVAAVHGLPGVDPLAAVRRAFPPSHDALGEMPLADEMVRFALGMRFSWFEVIEGIGVPRDVLGVLGAATALGRARAIEADGRWEEQPDGQPRLILPVWQDGWLVDLVALNSANRAAWSLLTGDGLLLGSLEADRAEGPLRLFGNPLDWLAAGCAGICVLRWGREALSRLRALGPGVTLVAADLRAASKLADLLRWHGLPQVMAADEINRSVAA